MYSTPTSTVSNKETLTWTDSYKIDGQKLRGFTRNANGDKLYTVYTFHSEDEKRRFSEVSLSGMTFLVEGELTEPASPAHVYAFHMVDYLQSKGAIGIYEVTSWKWIDSKRSIVTTLAHYRFQLKQHIERTFPSSIAAEAQALLIGLQENVDEDLQKAYQTLGITHIFAISGLHIALVAWIFVEGLLRLQIRRELATIVLLVILPVYGVLAGGAPSVWRAVSVVELVFIVRYFRIRLALNDALAISFILFVMLEPGVVYQVGFQLSYLATFSLIYSSKILGYAKSWWLKSFLVTFVCQLLVYPLLLWHFYEISISSLVANIVFVPLFSFIILPLNILFLLLTFLSQSIADFFFNFYEPIRLSLTNCILFLQSIPFQMWSPGRPEAWCIILAYISIFIVYYLIENKRAWKWAIAVFIVPIIFMYITPKMDSDLRVTFLNVGQGDCIVVELPYQKAVYVVDTGGLLRFEKERWKETKKTFEIGRQVVVPFLKGRGIRTIDALILTHADADHVEGAEEIIEEIRVREIHVTPQSLAKAVMDDLLKAAKQHQVPIKEKMGGVQWGIGKTQFAYLWPTDITYEGNNDSLILFLQHGRFRMLLTGDLEQEGELALMRMYGEQLQNVTVLKAGHHGSKTSSSEEFIQVVNPKLTIFSAGLNNRYGHPHQEVIKRFEQNGLPYKVTGIDGTIALNISNERIVLK